MISFKISVIYAPAYNLAFSGLLKFVPDKNLIQCFNAFSLCLYARVK